MPGWTESARRAFRAISWQFHADRLDLAARDFAGLREGMDPNTLLSLSVLVPVCATCHATNDWRRTSGLPTISPDNWELDLVLLGFPLGVIERLKTDIAEGVGAERGPWCRYCHKWIPWWEDEDGCWPEEESFADYMGFDRESGASVSKATKRSLIAAYGKRCFACKAALSRDDITVDHIVARSAGGKADFVNLQLLCTNCNRAKADSAATVVKATLHFPMRPVPSDGYEGVVW